MPPLPDVPAARDVTKLEVEEAMLLEAVLSIRDVVEADVDAATLVLVLVLLETLVVGALTLVCIRDLVLELTTEEVVMMTAATLLLLLLDDTSLGVYL